MAKDYFQDIVPPSDNQPPRPPAPPSPQTHESDDLPVDATRIPINTSPVGDQGRSIRNISAPIRQRPRVFDDSRGEGGNLGASRPGRSHSKFWMWGIAAVCVLVLAALLFVALRPTRVTLSARTHTLTFSEELFTAYPEESVTQGSLPYLVRTAELEDSEVVDSQGTVYAEDKASGNIVVYNDYQTTPLKLVKNTRFAAQNGLVYRTPAEVVVPAKRGSTPGSIEVTVVADKAGDQYNVAPGKFTVPGLQSTPAMFKGVYAESEQAFTGGFVGERPGVAAGELESAIASVRERLESKARESASQLGDEVVAFPELAQIEYESMPNTTEAGGGVRIHQKARVSIPVFAPSDLTAALGASAIGGTDPASISLIPGDIFTASPVGTSTVLGVGALSFSLTGSALLVWDIDEAEIKSALAGKDKGAFEAIVSGYPAVQEARARIEPFWKSTFPTDPEDIKIKIEKPAQAE